MTISSLRRLSQSVFPLELPFPDGNPVLTQLVGPHYFVKKIQLPTFYLWAESPTYVPERDLIIFSDVTSRTLNYYHMKTKRIVKVVENTPYINGMTQLDSNTLVGCAGNGTLVTIDINTGVIQPYVLGYEGKPFNSPNDVITTNDKRVLLFTDPPIGCSIPGYGTCFPGPPPQSKNRVYAYDRDTMQVTSLIDDLVSPNGLALTPDQKTLYVADLMFGAEGAPRIYKYDYDQTTQTVSNKVLFFENPFELLDGGLKLDKYGNIWVTTFRGIRVITPQAINLGQILFPENITNLTFVNDKVIYATGRYTVYYICPDFLHRCRNRNRG